MRASVSAGVGLLPAGCSLRPDYATKGGGEDVLARLPGKVAMRLVNDRPPCLETPMRYFRHDLTPNEALYVRSHLQTVPAAVDVAAWRLRIDGAVDRPLELSMDDLRRMGSDEVVAVNQCSGNSHSLFSPRVAGAQWRNGAMGNARWAGLGLAKLLQTAGVRRDAVQVTFDGLDQGPLASVPDFVKALDVDHALQPEVTVAYSMNNEPLPTLNGFPARLVVPGWYATYWVKALHKVTVLPHVFDGYWMAKAYRIPANPNGVNDPRWSKNAYALTAGAGVGRFAFSFVVLGLWPNGTLADQIARTQPADRWARTASANRGRVKTLRPQGSRGIRPRLRGLPWKRGPWGRTCGGGTHSCAS
jgi:DMSO/TMAO reductase YedYZ molybdopterin-dependent catalytic subunit